jgi:anti-sigma factor RsiW
MNCRGWNPQIALYVEGDLERDLAVQLERHLTSCEECRQFVDALRESQKEFRTLAQESIDMSSLHRVHGTVMERVRMIEDRRTLIGRITLWLWGNARWRYAALVLLVLLGAVAGGGTLWLRQSRVAPVAVVPSRPVLSLPAVPQPEQTAAPVPQILSPRPAAGALHEAASDPVQRSPLPLMDDDDATGTDSTDTLVQIVTDDPNVVIYWLIGQDGGF